MPGVASRLRPKTHLPSNRGGAGGNRTNIRPIRNNKENSGTKSIAQVSGRKNSWKMDVIESLAGMVSSMLEFPLVGFLGRLVPAGSTEAGQQVRRVSYVVLLLVFNLRKERLYRAVLFLPSSMRSCENKHEPALNLCVRKCKDHVVLSII